MVIQTHSISGGVLSSIGTINDGRIEIRNIIASVHTYATASSTLFATPGLLMGLVVSGSGTVTLLDYGPPLRSSTLLLRLVLPSAQNVMVFPEFRIPFSTLVASIVGNIGLAAFISNI